jgi:subtilase family serine protease
MDAWDFIVNFYVDDELIADKFIQEIEAYESLMIEVPYEIPPGDHTIKVVVDPDNRINELNENNNEAMKEIRR